MRKILPGCVLTLVFIFGIALAGMIHSTGKNSTSNEVIRNTGEVVELLRNGLKGHSQKITITFQCEQNILSRLSGFVEEWMEAAMQETEDPTEGDYIRYQQGGYETNCSYKESDGMYCYTIEIIPKYYMYLVQEEAVTEKVNEIFGNFDFDENTSDYEKIQTIYGYLCSRVSYDKVHVKNPYYYMRSTSYAALIQETATCQGYCVALYRMLRQAGIRSRIITGMAYGEGFEGLHAWNIVELDGAYYYLDATWDAGKDIYTYFLKGADGFPGHAGGEIFSSDEFKKQYPVAERDYIAR